MTSVGLWCHWVSSGIIWNHLVSLLASDHCDVMYWCPLSWPFWSTLVLQWAGSGWEQQCTGWHHCQKRGEDSETVQHEVWTGSKWTQVHGSGVHVTFNTWRRRDGYMPSTWFTIFPPLAISLLYSSPSLHSSLASSFFSFLLLLSSLSFPPSFPLAPSPKIFTGKDAIQVSGPPNQAQTRNFAVVNALHAFNKLMDEVSSFT